MIRQRVGKSKIIKNPAVVVFLGTIGSLLFAAQSHAQLAGANLSGIVQDAQGAPVPDAMVDILNEANGTTRDVTSNSDGLYDAPNLLPGVYDVTATAKGFQTLEQKGVSLTVGAQVALNLALKVGELSQHVEVTAEVPDVETTSSTLSATVEEKTVEDLPLNGRDWTQLALLQPGVASVKTQSASNVATNRARRGFGNEMTDSGHRPYENTYRIDGVNVNDYSNGAPGNSIGEDLGVDAIEEFNVVTTNYTADYGRTSGAVINAITKSGTNQFHGTGYFFDRDKIFNARNFFDPAVKPPFTQRQYGSSAGGPIIKNKLFIFGDYEGVLQDQSSSFSDLIPSAAALAGEMCSKPIASGPNACSPHTITISPAVVPYLALWPNPSAVATTPVGGSSDNGNTVLYKTSGVKRLDEDYFTIRVDYKLSEKDNLASTYFYDLSPQAVPDNLDTLLNYELSRRQMFGATETHVFGPTLINIVRFGWNHSYGRANAPDKAINPLTTSSALQIPGIIAVSVPAGPPAISITGVQGVSGLGVNSAYDDYSDFQAYDDVHLTRGTHSLSFGFTWEDPLQYTRSPGGGNGSFTFSNTVVNGANVSALENFLTDHPFTGAGSSTYVTLPVQPRTNLFGGYIQDSWRAHTNLTLNYGLRYEMVTNPTDAQNNFERLNTYGAAAGTGPCPNIFPNAFVSTTVPGCPVPIHNLFNTNPTLDDFDPRVGLSWDPFHDGKTAVRAGFGIFSIVPLPYVYTDEFFGAYPYSYSLAVPTGVIPPAGSFPNILPYVVGGIPAARYVEPNPKHSYSMNWNINIQRQINAYLSATVAYVGSHTVHESTTLDNSNQVQPTLINGVWTWPAVGTGTILDPNVGSIRPTYWDGSAHYEGLQAQLRLRPVRGLSGQIAYTLGRCFSNGDSSGFADPFTNSIADLLPFDEAMREGPCDFDIRHNFVANFFYVLPGPKSGALRTIAGGWQLEGIITVQSGSPFSLLTGGDPLGQKTEPTDYPNIVPGCNPYTSNLRSLAQPFFLNQNCFVLAPISPAGPVLGDLGRNRLYGPGLQNVDFSILKNFAVPRVSDDFNLQLRFEFFNLFNTTNFQSPIDNDTLGASLGLLDSTATPPREFQLAVKVIW